MFMIGGRGGGGGLLTQIIGQENTSLRTLKLLSAVLSLFTTVYVLYPPIPQYPSSSHLLALPLAADLAATTTAFPPFSPGVSLPPGIVP